MHTFPYIYIHIFWLKAATSVSRPAWPKPQPFCLKCKGLCLAAHSSCIFMNSWVQSAVAKPANPGHAKDKSIPSRTELRRKHRKHTQECYRLMKAKLLSLVCPLPASAILAADFEVFRESIYTVRAEEAGAEPEPYVSPSLHTGKNMCSWCAIWQPLPSPHVDSTGRGAG